MTKGSHKEITVGAKILLIIVSLLVFLPILLVAAVLHILWGCILYLSIWLTWRKQYVLLVYSDSPIWKDYVEREIIPHIKNKAIILNWSERKSWKISLSRLAFRYFGGDRNFNPIALVFRPFQLVETYRFYQAFKKFKHGNVTEVEEIKDKLLRDLGIDNSSYNDR
jgi:hypothetical protein